VHVHAAGEVQHGLELCIVHLAYWLYRAVACHGFILFLHLCLTQELNEPLPSCIRHCHDAISTSCTLLPADTFIQKTKKLYLDTRTQRNITKLSQDIAEVHTVMTRNIQDVLGQGERLDSECHVS
jgi:hypothetical protein